MSADPYRYTTLAHAGRTLLGPFSPASVATMLAACAPPPRGVLDIGCGKGAVLVGAMTRFGGHGTGVEPNPAFAADTRSLAAAAGVASQLTLHERAWEPRLVEGRRFGLVVCTGALHALGGYRAALSALHSQVEKGGYALLGPGYWRQEPSPEYLTAFGGSADELTTEAETRVLAERAGWRVVLAQSSSVGEWDHYEDGYHAAMLRWLAEHPEDADAPEFRRRMETWSEAYLRWGRDTMGYTLLLLQR
jgi:cyclopropane fatty-acyl-phospholipid synthase-like methyltransferase